ncbi:MAG TPA: hypothetical protein PKU80_03100 [Candidatus Limiplasma sp.]|nr:hypothetical protein [Candidatus Limiplasma sp.]
MPDKLLPYSYNSWCPPDIKEHLSEMCDNYTNKGRKHIRPQYRDTLIALDEHPPPARCRTRKKAAASAGT